MTTVVSFLNKLKQLWVRTQYYGHQLKWQCYLSKTVVDKLHWDFYSSTPRILFFKNNASSPLKHHLKETKGFIPEYWGSFYFLRIPLYPLSFWLFFIPLINDWHVIGELEQPMELTEKYLCWLLSSTMKEHHTDVIADRGDGRICGSHREKSNWKINPD